MFGFAYTEGGAWSDEGIKSVGRFVERIERAIENLAAELNKPSNSKTTMEKEEKELNFWRHSAIKGVTSDTEIFQFNTAIARLMEFTNALYKYMQVENKNVKFLKETLIDYIKLIAPFAPHFAEEQWNIIGMDYSVFNQSWPEFDPKALIKDEVEIAIQVNGKIKARVNVSSDASEDEIKSTAISNEDVKAAISGKNIAKVIVIKGRLVNIVAK